jgi:hypothetical protein
MLALLLALALIWCELASAGQAKANQRTFD